MAFPGGKIDLEWKNGLFVPVQGPTGLDRMAAEAKTDETFLTLLKRFNQQGRNTSDTKGTSYAPALFAQEAKSGRAAKEQLADAMRRLFQADKIAKANPGKDSKAAWTLEPEGARRMTLADHPPTTTPTICRPHADQRCADPPYTPRMVGGSPQPA